MNDEIVNLIPARIDCYLRLSMVEGINDCPMFIVLDVNSNRKLLMKCFYKESKVYKQLNNSEINILSVLNHPNIIFIKSKIIQDNFAYMFMDYYQEGDLWRAISERKEIDFEMMKAIMYDLAKAVYHMHCQDIIHGNISLENVLLDGTDKKNAILTGFSRASLNEVIISEENYSNFINNYTIYLSSIKRESCRENHRVILGKPDDVYALGIVFHYLLSYLESLDLVDFQSKVLIKDLIMSMIEPDPQKRISIDKVYNSEVFSKSLILVSLQRIFDQMDQNEELFL